MASSGSLPLSTFDTTATAKSLQSCPTLCDPIDGPPGSHQAPPFLGFPGQEHWSGLPFPSPIHESEKWKRSCSIVSDSQRPRDCSLPGSSVHGIFQARVMEWVAISLLSPLVWSFFRPVVLSLFVGCCIYKGCAICVRQVIFFSNPELSVLAANQHYSFWAVRRRRG